MTRGLRRFSWRGFEETYIGVAIPSKIKWASYPFAKVSGYGVDVYKKTKHVMGNFAENDKKVINLEIDGNSTVEIILLFRKGDNRHCCLGYRKEFGVIEIGFDDLDPNLEYCLAVSMCHEHDCVQIID